MQVKASNSHSLSVMAQNKCLYKTVQLYNFHVYTQGFWKTILMHNASLHKDAAAVNMPAENIKHVYPAHMLRNQSPARGLANSGPQISLAESTSSTKLDQFQSAAYQNDVAATVLPCWG